MACCLIHCQFKSLFINPYHFFSCMCAQVAGETLHPGCIGQCCAQTTSSSATSHRHLCPAQVTGECPVCTAEVLSNIVKCLVNRH